ncbi:MAG TPA: hypothetical protein VKR06_10675 [Ktedonosporobacter sp.]|nr:hypothetical protein [Ktedonosporobacter sp.]
MGPFLITISLIGILIVVGIAVSLRINAQHILGKVRFGRIRRVRTLKPLPDGTVLEETIVETRVEEAPTEEEA